MGKKEPFYCDVMAMNPGVTGSLNLISVRFPDKEEPNLRFIVDAGTYQENRFKHLNNTLFFNPEKISFCLVTHNHVDHIGRIPYLVKKGFRGTIYSTIPTSRLMPLALWDCFKVLKDSAKRLFEKLLYNADDVSSTLDLVKGCKYEQEIEVHRNVHVTFFKNGHLVGAALIYVRISYPGYEDINLLFTGDYKGSNVFFDVKPILKKILNKPLTIIQESTYGNMDDVDIKPCFKNNVLKCIQNGGTVVAPVLSLGRSQEVLFELKKMQESGELSLDVPIYFDGNLAIRYTNMYLQGLLDIREDMLDFLPQNLTFVDKNSRPTILADTNRKIILSTSGFGSFGPAQTYIIRFAQLEGNLIQFTTGFVGDESSMRYRLKNAKQGEGVTVGGILIIKRAMVEFTGEYSGHARANEMISFLKQFTNLKFVIVNHGEEETKLSFASRIEKEVKPKDKVGILGVGYYYRVGPFGFLKSMTTKF